MSDEAIANTADAVLSEHDLGWSVKLDRDYVESLDFSKGDAFISYCFSVWSAGKLRDVIHYKVINKLCSVPEKIVLISHRMILTILIFL